MEYLKPFLIGGSVIAGSKYVASYVNPSLAPLIGGMPTGIIASYFLTSNKQKREFFGGYVYSSFVLFLAILFIHLTSISTNINVNMISTFGLIVWGIISYIVIQHKQML
jgi:hypothetical protein